MAPGTTLLMPGVIYHHGRIDRQTARYSARWTHSRLRCDIWHCAPCILALSCFCRDMQPPGAAGFACCQAVASAGYAPSTRGPARGDFVAGAAGRRVGMKTLAIRASSVLIGRSVADFAISRGHPRLT